MLLDISIEYTGFQPSFPTQMFIESAMQEIREDSPTGSFVQATFDKKDNIVKGIVQVSTPAGPFFAVVTGSESKEVAQNLHDRMKQRFEKWKAKHYSSFATNNVSNKNQASI
jgi:hypothetical protein